MDRTLLTTLVATAFIPSVFGSSTKAITSKHKKTRPNIIFIITDQHRFDFIGSVNPAIITPYLDSLALDGNRFINGYSSTPSSTPARASILTGQSPWRHGLLGYTSHISSSYENAMPQMLTDAGYHTVAVGKMHWYPQRNTHGFKELYVDESGRVESVGFVSDYREWFSQVAPDLNPDSLGIGWNDHASGVYPLNDTLHPTWWTATKSIERIEARDKNKPLFLKVSFARPHSPYDPPLKYLKMYDSVTIDIPVIGEWSSEFADYPHKSDAAFGDYGVDYALNSRRHYAAVITFVDEQIGRVIDKLKEDGLYDNSLIIFTSDHGDMMGDHHHWRKTYPYEGSAHVPFIVRLPSSVKRKALKRGEVTYLISEMRDILPTMLEAAKVDIPESIEGMSLYEPIVKGRRAKWRDYIDMEHSDTYRPNSAWIGLTDGEQKYVWNYARGEEEFFDMTTEDSESVNLIGSKGYLEDIEMWRDRMVEHLLERGDTWVKDGRLQKRPSMLKSPNFKL